MLCAVGACSFGDSGFVQPEGFHVGQTFFFLPTPPKAKEEQSLVEQEGVVVTSEEGFCGRRGCGIVLHRTFGSVLESHCVACGHVGDDLQPALLNAVLVKWAGHGQSFKHLPLLRRTWAEDWESACPIKDRFIENLEKRIRSQVRDQPLIAASCTGENGFVLQSRPGTPTDKVLTDFIGEANDLRELVILRRHDDLRYCQAAALAEFLNDLQQGHDDSLELLRLGCRFVAGKGFNLSGQFAELSFELLVAGLEVLVRSLEG